MARHHEALATALDEAADAAEHGARDQHRAAGAARDAAREQRRGSPTGEQGSGRTIRLVLDLLGRSAERLAGAAGGVRRTWAAALAAEGLSIRQIGERLGVSHQRVSALLKRLRNSPGRGQRR